MSEKRAWLSEEGRRAMEGLREPWAPGEGAGPDLGSDRDGVG